MEGVHWTTATWRRRPSLCWRLGWKANEAIPMPVLERVNSHGPRGSSLSQSSARKAWLGPPWLAPPVKQMVARTSVTSASPTVVVVSAATCLGEIDVHRTARTRQVKLCRHSWVADLSIAVLPFMWIVLPSILSCTTIGLCTCLTLCLTNDACNFIFNHQ